MYTSKILISEEAKLSSSKMIANFKEKSTENVRELPTGGKKAPVYMKDSLNYQVQNCLSFFEFCESRIGKVIIQLENN